jgi:hypothetical protein
MENYRATAPQGVAGLWSEKYSVDMWSARAIEQLPKFQPPLPHTGSALDPQWFLGSLSGQWIPRLLAVRCGTEIVGIVCTKEKRIGGVPLRVVYGDGTLGNLVLAETGNQEAVLTAALEKLLSSGRVKALRLLLPPDGYEVRVAEKVAKSLGLRVNYKQVVVNHFCLTLPSSYEEFLTSLGHRTRKNFRRYRRQFERAGHNYVAHLSMEEMRAAANHLRTRCSVMSSRRVIERVCNWLAAVERPFACGLRSQNGEWLSVAAGFYTATGAVLPMQLNNDVDWKGSSFSIVLRSYFIESLIQSGYRELVFWAGVGGALARYVKHVPGTGLYVDSPKRSWQLVCSLVRVIGPRLPRKIRQDLEWIAPFHSDP